MEKQRKFYYVTITNFGALEYNFGLENSLLNLTHGYGVDYLYRSMLKGHQFQKRIPK